MISWISAGVRPPPTYGEAAASGAVTVAERAGGGSTAVTAPEPGAFGAGATLASGAFGAVGAGRVKVGAGRTPSWV
jgi:hypothetical protein